MTISEKKKVLAKLERGLKRITKGWHQGSMFYSDKLQRPLETSRHATSFCAFGALCDRNIYESRSSERAATALGRAINGDVVSFNDLPSTTKKDVVNMFRAAIATVKREIFYDEKT